MGTSYRGADVRIRMDRSALDPTPRHGLTESTERDQRNHRTRENGATNSNRNQRSTEFKPPAGFNDFLSPNSGKGKLIETKTHDCVSNGRRSPIPNLYLNDGLALPVPLTPHYDRMKKAHDKSNLRRLIDTRDPHFPGLKRLKFKGKELIQLPNDVFQLKELELLDLSPEREACLYYKLPGVPASISKLVNLRVLVLDTNELSELPPEIGLLAQMEHLALSNNHLSYLPDQIVMLNNLDSIHLANNRFTVFPKQLHEITSLTFLDLSDNKIEKIPGTIKKLSNLETLIMFANKLKDLPDELCELTQLRMLWIGDNLIKILPKNFGKLKYLDWDWHYTSTTLDGNPLEHPPMDICKNGMKAIDEYLEKNWSRIQRGMPVYTPQPVYVRDQRDLSDSSSQEERYQDSSRYGGSLDVDPRFVRNMRRGSTPIPSDVAEGLAGLDRDRYSES